MIEEQTPGWVESAYLNAEGSISHDMRASLFISSVHEFIECTRQNVSFLDFVLHGQTEVNEIVNFFSSCTSEFIIIPTVLKPMSRVSIGHMTLIIVDKINQRIVYYNSTGSSPLHESRPIKNIGTDIGVLTLLCRLQSLLSFEILYSPRQDQAFYSIFTCGRFSKQFIERYVLFPHLSLLVPIGM